MLKVSRRLDGNSEIFFSIQGEGANAGKPAVFLRLGICNLKCTWCDTKYAWDWETYNPKEQLIDMKIEEIAYEIMRYDRKYLVITGGEPMIQQNELIPLLEHLKTRQFFIEIETNGTIVPSHKLLKLIDHWSVSPKLESSGNPQSLREISECYRFFAGITSSHFKYVIQGQDDFNEVRSLSDKYDIAHDKVILMPEAQTREALLDRSRWLVELCKVQNYMFSTRLQILLWDNERGK